VAGKQVILGSVLNKKTIFDKNDFRTIELNPVLALMLQNTNALEQKKLDDLTVIQIRPVKLA
jgi:hypothetical protein